MDYEVNILPPVVLEYITERKKTEESAAYQQSQKKIDELNSMLPKQSFDLIGIFSYMDNKEKRKAIEEQCASEKERLSRKLEEISMQADKEYKDYLEQFEEQVQQKSVSFARSEVTKEVIGWLADKFKEELDKWERILWDREKWIVPFRIEVANNKITYDSPKVTWLYDEDDIQFVLNSLLISHPFSDKDTGEYDAYDFVDKRCQILGTGVEQAALARAIVSGLQSRVIADYPKGSGDTTVVADIKYRESTVVAVMVYTTLKGNYIAVRSWEEKTTAQTGQEELPTGEQALSDAEDTAGTAAESDVPVEDYMTQFEKDIFN